MLSIKLQLNDSELALIKTFNLSFDPTKNFDEKQLVELIEKTENGISEHLEDSKLKDYEHVYDVIYNQTNHLFEKKAS